MKSTSKIKTVIAFGVLLGSYFQAQSQSNETLKVDSLGKVIQKTNEEIAIMKRLKVTGYIQPQFQHIDSAGAPSVAAGDFVQNNNKYNNRIMMRRGRFKFTYTHNMAEIVVNADLTEKGVAMRETYGKITDPWLGMFSITTGLLQNQFGHELIYSSSNRETPERSRLIQTLFPTERDLGAFGTVEFPSKSFLSGLQLDVAVMNGVAGVAPEIDSNKDYTGKIHYSTRSKNKKYFVGFGVSCYEGGYRVGSVKDYRLTVLETGDVGYQFASDTANYDRVGKRSYKGADVQINLDWKIGTTTIRAEYVQGIQPGTSSSSNSPRAVVTSKIYHRNFDGACVYFIQNIGKTKLQLVAKYDWYDPNTKLSGEQIGKAGTNTANVADIRFDTYGLGANYSFNKNIKLMAYYDYVVNEKTLVPLYTKDIKDNVYTIRMQYRF